MNRIDELPLHVMAFSGIFPMTREYTSSTVRDSIGIFSHLEWPKYAWPGGYECIYHTHDGGILCAECANDELPRTIDPDDGAFYIIDVSLDCENENEVVYCDHCNEQLSHKCED